MKTWLLLFPLLVYSQLYVSPNGSGTSCTQSRPCSLSQAISNAIIGDQILLLDGQYNIGTPLTITTSDITISSSTSKEMVVITSGGTSTTPIFTITAPNVTFDSLSFHNFNTTILSFNNVGKIDNCNFNMVTFNLAYGIPYRNVIVFNNNATISNCQFENFSIREEISVSPREVVSGMINVQGSGTISNSTFTHIQFSLVATRGAILSLGNHSVVSNCTFDNSMQTSSFYYLEGIVYGAGTLEIHNCAMMNLSCSNYDAYDMMVLIKAVDLIITDSIFSDIYKAVDFATNFTSLFVFDSGTIDRCVFEEITLEIAISMQLTMIYSIGNAMINNSTFTNITYHPHNHQKEAGILVTQTGSVTNCYFRNYWTWVLYNNYGMLSFHDSGLVENNVFSNVTIFLEMEESSPTTVYGGVVYSLQNVTITACLFDQVTYNGAGDGRLFNIQGGIVGAVFAELNNCTFTSCSVNVNVSSVEGGMVYASVVSISDTYFINCSSCAAPSSCIVEGGIIYASNAASFIFNSTISSCGGSNLLKFSGTMSTTQFIGNTCSDLAIDLDGTMENCTFSRNSGAPALVTTTTGSANVFNCIFYNNTISGSICGGILYFLYGDNQVRGCNFTENHMGHCVTSYATSIYGAGSSLIIDTSNFTGDTIDAGIVLTVQSVIYVLVPSPTITNSIFTQFSFPLFFFSGGTAYSLAGVNIVSNTPHESLLIFDAPGNITFSLSGCIFDGNVVNEGSQYLQVISDSYQLIVDECSFQSNSNLILTATNGLTISSSEFTNNTLLSGTSMEGGLIQSSNMQCMIQNCSFTNNTLISTDPIPACRGGLVYISHSSSISNCSFTRNTINNCEAVYGGVLHFASGAENSVTSRNIFSGNVVKDAISIEGGVIFTEVLLALDDSVFQNHEIDFQNNENTVNLNNVRGGVVYATNGISLSGSTFYSNAAQAKSPIFDSQYLGAAVYIEFANTEQTISDCLFDSNGFQLLSVGVSEALAVETGGAAIYINQQNITYSLINSNFTNNQITATGCSMHYIYGGVIYTPYNLLIDQCNFAGNSVTFAPNTVLVEGGCLYFNYATISNSLFTNNTVVLVDLDCTSSLMDSTVSKGGCIFANSLSFTNSTFIDNTHEGSIIAGGIIFSNSTTMDISSLENNLCAATGEIQGGLLLAQSQLNVSRSTITGNELQGDSIIGAIGIGAISFVSASTFNRNNASSSSVQQGGLYAQSISISECDFYENTGEGALVEGTAVWASSASITSTSFTNNAGSSSAYSSIGGALWLDTSNLSLNDVSFTNNSADLGGGYSINHLSGLPIINNLTMIDNLAVVKGSEVFIIDNQMQSFLQCSEFIPDSSMYNQECASSIAYINATKLIKYVWPSQKFEIDLIFVDWFNNVTLNPFYQISLAPSPFMSSTVQLTETEVNQTYTFQDIQLYAPAETVSNLLFTAYSLSPKFSSNYSLEIAVISTSCPPARTHEFYETGLTTCVACADGTYNLSGDDCQACPQPNSDLLKSNQTNCVSLSDDNELVINPGWWPNSFNDATLLIPCPNPAACSSEIPCQVIFSEAEFNWTTTCSSCSGGNDFSNPESTNCYCDSGYEERLCTKCVCTSIKNCYAPSGGTCKVCDVYNYENLVIFIVVVVVGGIVLTVVTLIPKTTFFWIVSGFIGFSALAALGLIGWIYSTILFVLLLCYFLLDKKFPPGITKCLFYFLQLITTIVSLQSWPKQLYGLVDSFAVTNLNISFLSCFIPAFSNPLLLFVTFNLLVPLFVILGVLFIVIEAYLTALPWIQQARASVQDKLKSSRFFPSDSDFEEAEYSTPDNDSEDTYTQLDQLQGENSLLDDEEFVATNSMQQIKATKQSKLPKITELIFTLLNAAYFPVSLMSLSVLPCTDGFMSLYPWITCQSSTHTVFITIASLVIILFVLGYPIVLLVVIFFNNCSKRRLEKVFKHYKDGRANYELVFVVQKLLLVMSLTLLDGFSQQLLILLVLSASTILHYFCSPFESKSLNHLQLCSGVVLIYAYGFDVLNEVYSGNPATLSLIGSWFMASLVVIILVLFLVLIVRSHWFFRRIFCRRQRKEPIELEINSENFD